MIKKMIGFLLSVFFVSLVSCANDATPQRRPSSSVEGFAVDAQIVGGTVTVYSFREGVKGEGLGSTVTDEKGFYTLDLSAPDQHVLIEVKDGSYTEEASGQGVNMKPGQVLRAVTFYRSGSRVDLMVTPFTNLAAGLVAFKIREGSSIQNAVTEATSAISTMAGIDILTTTPHNITDIENVSTTFTHELKYGFMTAAISSWTAEASVSNGAEPHTIWNSIGLSQVMYRDISEDGLLDGKGLDPNSGTVLDLGFGLVPLDANSYRSGFARHLMAMVASEQNKTGITLSQAVPRAQNLGGLGHPIFGNLSPEPIDSEGPIITPAEAEGLFHNRVITWAVNVSDIVGLKSVVFDIDGEVIDQALDPQKPTVLINTGLYLDGEYRIGVRAIDNLRNESYRTFRINFANIGSLINVLSSTTVNRSPTTLSGNYIDNGQGMQSITVNGLPAEIDIENKTWSVEVPLVPPNPGQTAAFVKILPVVVTDSLGNQSSAFITMTMDTIQPIFDPVPQYSNATFISGGQVFTQKLSFAKTSGIPIRIETDHVSLNGTPILEGPLDQNNIPWILLHVQDVNINGVFTPEDEITAQIQYSLGGAILAPFHTLAPVITGNNDYRFIVPLASEILHEDWHQATPDDLHLIEVTIKDRAGNTTDFIFRFRVEFVPPPPVITSKAINSFNKPFVSRVALNPARLLVTQYSLSNDTNFSMLFFILDSSIHKVNRSVEDMVRFHQVKQTTYDETEGFNFTTGAWSPFSFQPAPNTPFAFINTSSDAVPAPTPLTDWVIDDIFLNVFDGGRVTKILVARIRSRKTGMSATNIGPINNATFFSVSNDFQTQGFEVEDANREGKISVGGWYAIPPGSTYTIKKFVQTPTLTPYNSTDVGNAATFASYTPRQYDKTNQWIINNQAVFILIHDIGFDKANQMVSINTTQGLGISTHTVSR